MLGENKLSKWKRGFVTNTVRSEGHCALRHKQIFRNCRWIKLNGFRPA